MTMSAEFVKYTLTAHVPHANIQEMTAVCVWLFVPRLNLQKLTCVTVSGKCGHNFHMVGQSLDDAGGQKLMYFSIVLWSGSSRSHPKANVQCADKVG